MTSVARMQIADAVPENARNAFTRAGGDAPDDVRRALTRAGINA